MPVSAGDASTAGNYELTFAGTTVAEFVQSFTSRFRRLNAVQRRQNFWHDTILLDGSYPAQVWDHQFTVYQEAANRNAYATAFFDLEDLIFSDPRTLLITAVSTVVAQDWDFGLCYLEAAEPATPTELQLFRAGFITVRFVGNQKPVEI